MFSDKFCFIKKVLNSSTILFTSSNGFLNYNERSIYNCYYEKINGVTKKIDVPFDIPDSWAWLRIKNFAEVKNGFTPRRDNKNFWADGKIPWFTIEDKHEQGNVINYTKQHITECATTPDRIVSPRSVLLCCTASVGEVAFTNISLTTNQQFNAISVFEDHKKIINIEYIFFFAMTLKRILRNDLATATTFGFVSVGKVKEILVPIPPKEEQDRIIKSLTLYIDLLKAIQNDYMHLCILKDKLKLKILDDIFDENSRYKSYYMNEKLMNLSSNITKGSTPTTYGYQFVKSGINFIKVENVADFRINHSSLTCFISQEAHDFQRRSQLKKNDLLVSIAGTLGRLCLIHEEDLPANTNQAFAIIKGYSSIIEPEYLKYYLIWYINKKSTTLGHGGGMMNLTLGEIKALSINYPIEKRLQIEIVNHISTCFSLLDNIV